MDESSEKQNVANSSHWALEGCTCSQSQASQAGTVSALVTA